MDVDDSTTAKASSRRLACLTGSLLLFASIATAVIWGASDGIDALVRTTVNGWANPKLTAFFLFVTQLGSVAVVYTLTAVEGLALLALGHRRAALHLVTVMTSAAVVNNAVKFTVARARPEPFFGDLPSSYSFASGHALYAGCVYGVLGSLLAAQMTKPWQRALILGATIVLIGLIGVSRVYLGVHYPTDVVAGFALAALILCVASGFFGRRAS